MFKRDNKVLDPKKSKKFQNISKNLEYLDRVEFRPLEKFQKGQKHLKISQKISSNLDRVEYLDRVKFRPLAQQKKQLKKSQNISKYRKKSQKI